MTHKSHFSNLNKVPSFSITWFWSAPTSVMSCLKHTRPNDTFRRDGTMFPFLHVIFTDQYDWTFFVTKEDGWSLTR